MRLSLNMALKILMYYKYQEQLADFNPVVLYLSMTM
jgi:hypothetical protein